MTESIALRELVETWQAVRTTSGRLDKRAHMAALFQRLSPADLRRAACWLAGELSQGALQVGWRTIRDAAARGASDLPLFAGSELAGPPPRLDQVDACFERLREVAGPGAERRRTALLAELWGRASPEERDFLAGLLLGELRAGALRALVIEALAAALQLAPEDLRRAIMFAGDFPAVVEAVAAEGEVALRRFGPRPLVPIEPMLASVAPSAGEAVAALGAAAVEWKLDGVRIQLHRDGDVVRAYSRQLRDVSALVPEVIALGRRFSATRFILDGEVVAFDRDQRPLAFQDLMSRFSTERDTTNEAPAALEVPLVPLFFDLLFLDEAPLVDRPYRERRSMLEQVVPEAHRVPAAVAASSEEAEHLYSEALGRGHEGVVVKSLEAPYTAGRRGAHWQKVKPAVTLDLVILAVEWGHGRRSGLLSNLHLGARVAGESDRFVMLGKTFKGLTDEMLRSMTEDLLALETHRDGIVVFVRPERVVEIAFDAVQRSPRYDSGFALRFARVKRFRPDKRPEEAATLDEVLAAGESGRKS